MRVLLHISKLLEQLPVSLPDTILFLQAALQQEEQSPSPRIPAIHTHGEIQDQAILPSNLGRETQPVTAHLSLSSFVQFLQDAFSTKFSEKCGLAYPTETIIGQLRQLNQQESAAFLGSEVLRSIFLPPPAPPAPSSTSMETHPPSEQTGSTVQDGLEAESEESTDPEDAGNQQTPAQGQITHHQVEGQHEETSEAAAGAATVRELAALTPLNLSRIFITRDRMREHFIHAETLLLQALHYTGRSPCVVVRNIETVAVDELWFFFPNTEKLDILNLPLVKSVPLWILTLHILLIKTLKSHKTFSHTYTTSTPALLAIMFSFMYHTSLLVTRCMFQVYSKISRTLI